MTRRFIKHKLLLDEGVHTRQHFPILNSRYQVKHVSMDLRKSGISDQEVYNIAIRNKYLIVTYNSKHFRKFASMSSKAGIIGVSPNIVPEQIDKKLTSLLARSRRSDLYCKFTYIRG